MSNSNYVSVVETMLPLNNEIFYAYIFCKERVTAERIKRENDIPVNIYSIENCLVFPNYKVVEMNDADKKTLLRSKNQKQLINDMSITDDDIILLAELIKSPSGVFK